MTTLATSIVRAFAALDMNTLQQPVLEKAQACLLNAYGRAVAARPIFGWSGKRHN